MKDVVTLLLENRPSSPIAFMAKYFRTVTQGSSPLLRAYRYIRLASPSQDAFVDVATALEHAGGGDQVWVARGVYGVAPRANLTRDPRPIAYVLFARPGVVDRHNFPEESVFDASPAAAS